MNSSEVMLTALLDDILDDGPPEPALAPYVERALKVVDPASLVEKTSEVVEHKMRRAS